jgi:hypothetical protein
MVLDKKFQGNKKEKGVRLTVNGKEGTVDPTNKVGKGTFRKGFAGMVEGQEVIVKTFHKKPHAKADDWKDDVQESKEAQMFANEYGTKVHDLNKKFTFAVPKVFKIVGDCDNDEFDEGDRVLVEPRLKGKFTKWNNNNKYKWKDAPGKGHGAVVQAFCHWTYHKTGGKKMVLDLQGTYNKKDGYTFTDPAIVTRTAKKGGPNIGKKGMDNFFASYNKYWPCHKKPFSEFCKEFWLRPHDDKSGTGKTKHTIVTEDSDSRRRRHRPPPPRPRDRSDL